MLCHSATHELQSHVFEPASDGGAVATFECADRCERILAAARVGGVGDVCSPMVHGLGPVLRVHHKDYVAFLQGIWQQLQEPGVKQALASVFPGRSLRQDKVPVAPHGQLGYYGFDTSAPLTAGTWAAALSSVDTALTAQHFVQAGERAAFALCRPPGHHAGHALYGGYCFLNNAAIAAQAFIDAGRRCVAVLDIDYHHGNGTQVGMCRNTPTSYSSNKSSTAVFPHLLFCARRSGVKDCLCACVCVCAYIQRG